MSLEDDETLTSLTRYENLRCLVDDFFTTMIFFSTKRLLARTVVEGNISSMTGMGHARLGGRFCLELSPQAYDAFFEELQAIVSPQSAITPPLNEHAWWALLALDFDCEPTSDENVARRRTASMRELARLFVQELEMHFTGYEHASIVVAQSWANRYRFYFLGVPYINIGAVYRLVELVKAKAHADDDLLACLQALDWGPTKQRHLRVHGTIGVDKEGRDKPSSKYRVAFVVYDSNSTMPRTSRLSIRPDAAAYERMLNEPETAYLQCCSNFVRQRENERQEASYWTVGLLERLFDIQNDDDDDDESSDSMFGSGERSERSEAMTLLVSPIVVVAEYKGVRCLLIAHGVRAATATVHYSTGGVVLLDGLNSVQLQEPFDLNDATLLTGPAASSYTEHLRQPKVLDMRAFPVLSFCYRNGLSHVTPTFKDGSVEWHYEVTAERQVTPPFDTLHMVGLLTKSCNVEFPSSFEVTSGKQTVSDSSVVRFADAFDINRTFTKSFGTEVLLIEAGCGVGKTVYALKLIERLARRNGFSVLCVTPRAQLCAQLATKLKDVAGLTTHLYNDGEWPADVASCVVTVDSLVKCVAPNGVSRTPTLVLLDEVELTAKHLATSETLSTTAAHRLRTLETLLVLLASARYVIAMDAQLGFAASLLMAMVALKRDQLGDYNSLHYQHQQLVDNRVQQRYCVLNDDFRRFIKVRDALIASKNVIVFESSPRKATALLALVEEHVRPGNVALLLHGKSDADVKRMFASNPSAYLRVNKVQLLVHTSSLGVGVSIDDPHFHEAHVAFRPHMTDEAAVQASHRARHLQSQVDDEEEEHEPAVPSAVREVYVLFDKRMRFSERRLQSIYTVGDAIVSLQRRIEASREMHRRYADFTQISSFDARVVVSPHDVNTLYVAALLAATEMSVNVQGLITVTRVFDEAVDLHYEGVTSSAEDLRIILDAERAVDFDMSILPTDSARTRSQKSQLLRAIGYDLQEGLASKQFMGRLTFGMSHPSNLRRFASLLVLLIVDDEALNLHVQNVLENVTETMPLYAQDDARGITIGVESVAVAACLKALGVTIEQFPHSAVVRVVDVNELVANFSGGEVAFSTFFETIQKRFRGPRWSQFKQRKTLSAKVRGFVNSFFGGSVIESRTYAWDARQIALSAELVPGYCRAQSIELPPAVSQWCATFNGSWTNFIAQEANGTHQKSVY